VPFLQSIGDTLIVERLPALWGKRKEGEKKGGGVHFARNRTKKGIGGEGTHSGGGRVGLLRVGSLGERGGTTSLRRMVARGGGKKS